MPKRQSSLLWLLCRDVCEPRLGLDWLPQGVLSGVLRCTLSVHCRSHPIKPRFRRGRRTWVTRTTLREPASRASSQVDFAGVTLRIAEFNGGDYALLKAAGFDNTSYKLEVRDFSSGNVVAEAIKRRSARRGP